MNRVTRRRYKSLVIPEALYLKVQRRVDESGGRYVSVAEVVREAVWMVWKLRIQSILGHI